MTIIAGKEALLAAVVMLGFLTYQSASPTEHPPCNWFGQIYNWQLKTCQACPYGSYAPDDYALGACIPA